MFGWNYSVFAYCHGCLPLPQRYLVQATSQRMWATWSIGLAVLGQFSRSVFLCHFASVLDKNSSWHGSGCKLLGVNAVCPPRCSSSLCVCVRPLCTPRAGHAPIKTIRTIPLGDVLQRLWSLVQCEALPLVSWRLEERKLKSKLFYH